MKTPAGASKPLGRVETPLTDVVNRNLKVALANSTRSNVSEMQAASASPQLAKTAEKEVNGGIDATAYLNTHGEHFTSRTECAGCHLCCLQTKII